MREGLKVGSKSSLKMIPTFVTRLPTGKEKGTAYALDIGGSNLRVLKVDLDGAGHAIPDPRNIYKEEIPRELQNSDADQLFGFIADCVAKVVKTETHLGFTFSFPVAQKNIHSGVLINWTKGFTATGVESGDVVALLNKSFTTKAHYVPTTVNALINDTTGTLLAGAYSNVDSFCPIGLILGTGSNACYYERIENIEKLDTSQLHHPGDKFMIINMESGNFGSRPDKKLLPLTRWDKILNEESNNPNQQLLEKQISGMYLGEITRIILDDSIEREKLFPQFKGKVPRLKVRYGFPTSDMSEIEADQSKSLEVVVSKLASYGITSASLEEKQFVKRIINVIASRAAVLVAAQLAACLSQMNLTQHSVAVAVDGSVFEKYPNFPSMIAKNLKNILGHDKVKLILAKDGSGVGAAIASFLENE